ncbi:hypothetical protein K469DRAFT_721949 [Zopfia rhizophila CBS 207.26]|uniref:Uncharacterized protein n=1 Tax=Zopfia rhizophila CBS 207.26 TaxID=1314779 RepID=A0A6A6DC79_9PEZI|nr:hypothetical protein K469DRAFT_721949 [Zopfia rhizophila CBS 207.26]
MASSAVFSALVLLVFALGVSGYDWVDMLPDCWQDCLNNSNDVSCDSARCICKASKSDSFLPDAVYCAHSNCDAEDWAIDAFLIPLQVYCGAIGKEIPYSILSSAQCAATETSQQPKATSTRRPHSQDSNGYKSKSKGGDELTSLVTTTVTQTTTDENGATLQIIVPVVMGPNTISYGKTITSSLEESASATGSPSSAAVSQSPTPAASASLSTQAQQGQIASSTTSSKKSEKTSNNNGSPFENMQAGATRWSFSGALVGLGILAGVFTRL